jgi:hypothetical protein
MKNLIHTHGHWSNGASSGEFCTGLNGFGKSGNVGSQSAFDNTHAIESGWRKALGATFVLSLVMWLVMHPAVLIGTVAFLFLYEFACRKFTRKIQGN